MKTRSIRYVGPEKIEFVDVNVSDPAAGEVQVQSLACGVCTWDLFTYKNGPGVSRPRTDGHEGVGRVIRVGAGVTNIKEGARVVAALRATRPARGKPLPDPGRLQTARRKLDRRADPPVSSPASTTATSAAGDRVAVVGCGFMGLMLVQVLGRCPLDQLIAIDIDPRGWNSHGSSARPPRSTPPTPTSNQSPAT